MPVYNGQRFLASTIESVLKQTHVDFEFLIVNDGSTDRSEDIIRSFDDDRIRLINHRQNRGIYQTNMEGIDEAQGEFIALMDHDDICLPNRLECQYNYLMTNPHVAICGGNAQYINEKDEVIGEIGVALCDSDTLKAKLLFSNQLANPSVMFRKSIFAELGGYHPYGLAEDYDFYLRASEQYNIVNLTEPLLYYRWHDSNTSLTKERQMIAAVKMVLKALQQRLGFDNVSERSADIHHSFMTGTRGSEFTARDYQLFLRNFQKIHYIPTNVVKKEVFKRWAEIVIYKGGRSAIFLLFDKKLFHFNSLTFKHVRRALKCSLKGYLSSLRP